MKTCENSMQDKFMFKLFTREGDGELFQNMNTRVPSEPILLLTHEFKKNYPFIKWMQKTSLNN